MRFTNICLRAENRWQGEQRHFGRLRGLQWFPLRIKPNFAFVLPRSHGRGNDEVAGAVQIVAAEGWDTWFRRIAGQEPAGMD